MPVTNQDRTKSVLEQLGFAVSMDTELRPGFRWIEMDLPGGQASVALVRTGPELPIGIDTGPDVPLMFSFVDPDGNRFYVSETSAS